MTQLPLHIDKIVNEVRQLVSTWSAEERSAFWLTHWNEQSPTRYHLSLGRYIRNTYNLWALPWEPEIVDGIDFSPYHPDAVSSTIIAEAIARGPIKNV